MAKDNRVVQKRVRLTIAEDACLQKNAKERGISDSEYIRLVLSQKPNDYPEIQILLKRLINEVNHVGTNINQIVKNYNSGFYNENDKAQLVAYLRKICLSIDKVVESIGNQ